MADDPSSSSNAKPPPPTAEAIAVAVKQNEDAGHAPQVIAGGKGRVAEQILEIAFSQGIRVREDADLAQMLSVVDIESEIPLEAFATVAEILTYVYEANNALNPDHEQNPPDSPDAMVKTWMADKGNPNE